MNAMWSLTRCEVRKMAVWTVFCGALFAALGYVEWHLFTQIGALLVYFLGVSLMAPYLYGWTDTPPKGYRGTPRQNGHGAPKGAA